MTTVHPAAHAVARALTRAPQLCAPLRFCSHRRHVIRWPAPDDLKIAPASLPPQTMRGLVVAAALAACVATTMKVAVPCTWVQQPQVNVSISGSALAGLPISYSFATTPPCGSLALKCYSGGALVFSWSSAAAAMAVPAVALSPGAQCECACGNNSPTCAVNVYVTA